MPDPLLPHTSILAVARDSTTFINTLISKGGLICVKMRESQGSARHGARIKIFEG
jgi:hypothetical protein